MRIVVFFFAFVLGAGFLKAADWRCITIGKDVVYFFDVDSVVKISNGNRKVWVKIAPSGPLVARVNEAMTDPQGTLTKRIERKMEQKYMPLELQLKTVKSEIQGMDSAGLGKFWLSLVQLEEEVNDFAKDMSILQWEMDIPARKYRVLNFDAYDKNGISTRTNTTPLPWTEVVPDSPISDLIEEFGILGL